MFNYKIEVWNFQWALYRHGVLLMVGDMDTILDYISRNCVREERNSRFKKDEK